MELGMLQYVKRHRPDLKQFHSQMLMWRIIHFHKKSLYKTERSWQVLFLFIHFFWVLHSLLHVTVTHRSLAKGLSKFLLSFTFTTVLMKTSVKQQTAVYGLKMILKGKAPKACEEIHVYHITSPTRNRFILYIILEKKDCFSAVCLSLQDLSVSRYYHLS